MHDERDTEDALRWARECGFQPPALSGAALLDWLIEAASVAVSMTDGRNRDDPLRHAAHRLEAYTRRLAALTEDPA